MATRDAAADADAGDAAPIRIWPELVRFWTLAAFLIVCAAGGGAARADVLSLLYTRPAAILAIAIFLLTPGKLDLRSFRAPFLLLAALGAAILIQLVPLPPSLWTALPGHAPFAEAAAAAGMPQPWRPISLTPTLTWNSFAALLTPLAVLVGLASLRREQIFALLPFMIAIAVASAVFGVLQLTSEPDGPLYLYRITHEGSAVGFFANRNHQALLLAVTLPALRVWTLVSPKRGRERLRLIIAAAVGVFLIPAIMVTGSRAGISLGAVGLLSVGLMGPLLPRGFVSRLGARAALVRISLWVVPLALAIMVALLGRAVALNRLVATDAYKSEVRFQNTPLTLDLTAQFFPVGSGFGSFDPVFRTIEPDRTLNSFYFNHAHNDLIELAMTGGLPAVAILALFLLWWGRRTYAAFRGSPGSTHVLFARLGAVVVAMACLASLVDYPLRTPVISAFFALACGWLALERPEPAAPARGEKTE